MLTFQDARATVAHATGRQAADYGWENDDVYVVAVDYGSSDIPFDEPDRLVDKRTGQLTEVFGMLGEPPAVALRPIGAVPDA